MVALKCEEFTNKEFHAYKTQPDQLPSVHESDIHIPQTNIDLHAHASMYIYMQVCGCVNKTTHVSWFAHSFKVFFEIFGKIQG